MKDEERQRLLTLVDKFCSLAEKLQCYNIVFKDGIKQQAELNNFAFIAQKFLPEHLQAELEKFTAQYFELVGNHFLAAVAEYEDTDFDPRKATSLYRLAVFNARSMFVDRIRKLAVDQVDLLPDAPQKASPRI